MGNLNQGLIGNASIDGVVNPLDANFNQKIYNVSSVQFESVVENDLIEFEGTTIDRVRKARRMNPPTNFNVVEFSSVSTQNMRVCKIDDTKFIVAYTTSGGIKARVGILTGGFGISYGAEVTIAARAAYQSSMELVSTDKILICWADASVSPNSGYAEILSISGNTITMNTPITTGTNSPQLPSVKMLTATTAIVACGDASSMSAFILTISGVSLSKGTTVTVKAVAGHAADISVLSSTSALLTYSQNTKLWIESVVLTVSGTTITVNSANQWLSVAFSSITTCKMSSNRVLVVYTLSNDTEYAIVLVITGTSVGGGYTSTLSTSTSNNGPTVEYIDPYRALLRWCAGNFGQCSFAYLVVIGNAVFMGTPQFCSGTTSGGAHGVKISDTKYITVYSKQSSNFGETDIANPKLSVHGIAKTAGVENTPVTVYTW